MEIRKPDIDIPKVIQQDNRAQTTPQPEGESTGFTQVDFHESAPNAASQDLYSILDPPDTWNSTEEISPQPHAPPPSFHGPHFELGGKLRENEELADGFSPTDTPAAEEIIAIANEAFAPEDIEKRLAEIVENLKDRIQDSAESAIHPFEDWFD